MPATSLAHPDLELVDLFGNGLPDILEMNGTVRYWRNLGGGRFDLPREMRTALQASDWPIRVCNSWTQTAMVAWICWSRPSISPGTIPSLWPVGRRSFHAHRLPVLT